MPLVLDPEGLPRGVLEELHRSLRGDLEETLELVLRPRGTVRDPASLATAEELIRATLAVLDRAGARSAAELGHEANAAYAALLATIDLVKSHTDVPRVPARRPSPPP